MGYPSSEEDPYEFKRTSADRVGKTSVDSSHSTSKPPDHKDPGWKHGTNLAGTHRPLPSPMRVVQTLEPGTGSVHRRDGGNSTRSDSMESTSAAPFKPHTGADVRWGAINIVNARDGPIGLSHFRLLKRIGYGDIGSVYLVELRGTGTYYAMKVMDKASLVSRNKLLRAQMEREILGLLDHPFLPTLYTHFETDKFYCLVMEFCSGGNLHSLRQKQPNKYFTEEAAR